MVTVSTALADFLLACRADGLRPGTVRWYKSLLSVFAGKFGDRQLAAITVRDMRNYLADLQARPDRYLDARYHPPQLGALSVETVRGHVRALRRLWAWAIVEYEFDPTCNPMKAIRTPRKQQAIPKAIALDDLRALLLAAPDTIAGRRDKAMVAFLADTGCRAAGMLSLRLPDLDTDAGRATIREKGERSRIVAFTPYTASVIEAWLRVRPQAALTVFCGLSSAAHGRELSLSGLHLIIKRLKKLAGVTGRANPHSFRHGFARQWLRNKGDMGTLARIMGHADPATTLRSYAVFSDEEALQVHGQFSPMKDF